LSDDLSIPNPAYEGSRNARYGGGQAGMDRDTKRLIMFASSLGCVVVALIGASTLTGRRSGEIPVIVADARPFRVKPENPGGMKIDGSENDLFSGASNTSNARLAPAAETPNPDRLHAAAPIQLLPAIPGPPPVVTPILPAQLTSVGNAPFSKPISAAPPKSSPSLPERRPEVHAAATNLPPATAPLSATAPAATGVTPVRATMVQLAALTTEQAAHDEWQLLSKRMPDLLNGHQPSYSRFERDGRAFWRLRTSGFTDVAQAKVFCDHVRAKGGGCSVADF